MEAIIVVRIEKSPITTSSSASVRPASSGRPSRSARSRAARSRLRRPVTTLPPWGGHRAAGGWGAEAGRCCSTSATTTTAARCRTEGWCAGCRRRRSSRATRDGLPAQPSWRARTRLFGKRPSPSGRRGVRRRSRCLPARSAPGSSRDPGAATTACAVVSNQSMFTSLSTSLPPRNPTSLTPEARSRSTVMVRHKPSPQRLRKSHGPDHRAAQRHVELLPRLGRLVAQGDRGRAGGRTADVDLVDLGVLLVVEVDVTSAGVPGLGAGDLGATARGAGLGLDPDRPGRGRRRSVARELRVVVGAAAGEELVATGERVEVGQGSGVAGATDRHGCRRGAGRCWPP